MFNYFTSGEIDKFTFYRMPKVLITDDYFKKISCEAKLLYGLLLDRASLSKTNCWIDEEDRIYVYFTQDEAKEMLNIGVGKTVSIFNELEKIGLILRKKQGQGKPVKIYVMNFAELIKGKIDETESGNSEEIVQTFYENREMEVKTSKNRKSENFDNKMEVKTSKNRKSKHPKIESLPFFIENKTKKSKTNLSINQEKREVRQKSDVIDGIDYNAHKCVAMEQIDFNRLSSEYGVERITEIVELIALVYSTPQSSLPIGGVQTDIQLIRERFSQLEYEHIQYVLDCVSQAQTKISNRRNYLLTCLFSAPITIDGYYANQVAHDMSSG